MPSAQALAAVDLLWSRGRSAFAQAQAMLWATAYRRSAQVAFRGAGSDRVRECLQDSYSESVSLFERARAEPRAPAKQQPRLPQCRLRQCRRWKAMTWWRRQAASQLQVTEPAGKKSGSARSD